MVPGTRAGRAEPGSPGKWLNTPLGWARANVLYDCSKQPPKHGSLMEVVLLMVFNSRVAQGMAATRAVAQASIGGEAAVEAFTEYTDIVTKRVKDKKKSDMREKLDKLKDMQMVKFRPAEGIGISGKKARLRSVRRKET
jgi:hypothetical protein